MKIRYFSLIALLLVISLNSCEQTTIERPGPKNIIIMIADGAGYDHIQIANLYEEGKTEAQPYEQFPVRYFVSTYPALAGDYYDALENHANSGYSPYETWHDFDWRRHGFTGSGAASTAMATGMKTYNGAIGVNITGQPLLNITERAKDMGKSAGVVSSVQFAHATAAAFSVHNTDRDNYPEIARDMLIKSRLDVIMGCGHPYYDNDGKIRQNALSFKYVGDSLLWSEIHAGKARVRRGSGIEVDLADVNGDGQPDAWELIDNIEEFENLAQGETPLRALGVAPNIYTLQQARGDSIAGMMNAYDYPFIEKMPSLETMTAGALNVLDNNNSGFFLLIEGGAIDWASHSNQKGRLIEEMSEFNKAVRRVIDWIETSSGWDETLLIVTADHETGYVAGPDSGGDPPQWFPPLNNGRGNMPGFDFHSTDHTNALVPLYAKGKGSELFAEYADEYDPVRGEFITNSEIGQLLFRLFGRGKALRDK
ncbi:MAG: alkaline phosphatase [Candidatus Kapaibacterium sp.]